MMNNVYLFFLPRSSETNIYTRSSEISAMLHYLFVFCNCIVLLFFQFSRHWDQNVLLEISVSSLSLLLFTWCMWFFVFCFLFSPSRSRSPKSFCSYPLPRLGSPVFLVESMVWMWEFSSMRIRMYCLKFLYLHFSPPVRLVHMVICFSFVFYLSRSGSRRCFALTASSALLIESYGVNVGMSSVAASHSHIY